MNKWLIALMITGVYVLHQDFWNWQSTELVLWGLLPVGLAYHAAYSVLAAGLMAVLVRVAWPSELDSTEEHSAHPSPEEEP